MAYHPLPRPGCPASADKAMCLPACLPAPCPPSSSPAASAVAVKRPQKQLSGDAPPLKPAVVIPDSSSSSPAAGSNGSSGSNGYIGAPPSAEALSEWKAALASHKAWSDALPVLQQYYLQHGYGVTSRNAALRCVKELWVRGGG